jgi:probable rRNA maturation factor
VSIDIANEAGIGVDEVALVRIARYVLDQMRIHPLAELSVLLVDEKAMAELHERWMGEPGPTDVLAFPMDELRPPHLAGVNVGRAGAEEPGPDPGLLGDVVLCPQVAASQARDAGHSTQDELELLSVHGILHLLGYDHADAGERAEMFGLQDRLLGSWRAERAPAGDGGDGGQGGEVPEGPEGSGLCHLRAGCWPLRSCSSSWRGGGRARRPRWSACRPSARNSWPGRAARPHAGCRPSCPTCRAI